MLNAELVPFLEEWNLRWSTLKPGATPRDRREKFEEIAAEMRLETPADVDTGAEYTIQSEMGAVRVRVFRHAGGGPRQPCLVYMHGGAWLQGSPETHWDITSRIAAGNRQTVISVDYALAPEHPFPAAVTQCQAVVRWAFDDADVLDIDRGRIAVGGDSAGANLAAAMALSFRDTRYGLIGQLLIYPAVDFEMKRPSYAENADGPLITTASMPAVNAMYCPDPRDLRNPLAAPMLAESHAGLPPAFIATAEHDPLRDDGIDYAETLRKAGVPVELDRGEGLIHGYLRAMDYCVASREKLEAMIAWLDRVHAVAR